MSQAKAISAMSQALGRFESWGVIALHLINHTFQHKWSQFKISKRDNSAKHNYIVGVKVQITTCLRSLTHVILAKQKAKYKIQIKKLNCMCDSALAAL